MMCKYGRMNTKRCHIMSSKIWENIYYVIFMLSKWIRNYFVRVEVEKSNMVYKYWIESLIYNI